MSSDDRSMTTGIGKYGAEQVLPSLVAYRTLLEELDAYGDKLRARYREHIVCREGCSGCCSLRSVFAVEACSMFIHVYSMPAEKRRTLFGITALEPLASDAAVCCPFLLDDRCLVYDARPVICRTHGYPLLVEGKVDYCSKNFAALRTIESDFILDLDALNTRLARINIAFIKENGDPRFSRVRIGMRDLGKMLGA